MRKSCVRIEVRRMIVAVALSSLMLTVIALPEGRAQERKGAKVQAEVDQQYPRSEPMPALVARTWIALHESKVRPLPDQTPLRKVLRALQDATRGKAGLVEGVTFEIKPVTLLEAEITLDQPVTLPFVGHPEISVDVYLKYLLHEFVWERYVGEGLVIIDSPGDDWVGYATVSLPEARTRLALHEVVPLSFPLGAPLEDVLTAIVTTTKGRAQDGHGLVIYARPRYMRGTKRVPLKSPVTIDTRDAEIGDSLRAILKQVGLAYLVLADGTVLVSESSDGKVLDRFLGDFPQYRHTYSFVWEQWVKALSEASDARFELRRRTPTPAKP